MNPKMYFPASCLLFCIAYVFVVDTAREVKLFMIFAGFVFALLLLRAKRNGK